MLNHDDIERGKHLAESGKYTPSTGDARRDTDFISALSTPELELDEDEWVAGRMPEGQMRMALGVANFYADKLLFVHGVGWHFWDGKRWAYDDIGATKRAVFDVLKKALVRSIDPDYAQLRRDVRKCESASGVAGVLELASGLTAYSLPQCGTSTPTRTC